MGSLSDAGSELAQERILDQGSALSARTAAPTEGGVRRVHERAVRSAACTSSPLSTSISDSAKERIPNPGLVHAKQATKLPGRFAKAAAQSGSAAAPSFLGAAVPAPAASADNNRNVASWDRVKVQQWLAAAPSMALGAERQGELGFPTLAFLPIMA